MLPAGGKLFFHAIYTITAILLLEGPDVLCVVRSLASVS